MFSSFTGDIILALPLIILAGGILALLSFEALSKERWPHGLTAAGVLGTAFFASLKFVDLTDSGLRIFGGTLFADPVGQFFTMCILGASLIALLLGMGSLSNFGISEHCEFYVLFLSATLGAVLFASASEFITLFVGLEFMSLPLYALCGSVRKNKRSTESSLKYFLLGSFSSAFLLYGIAIIYGMTGSLIIQDMSAYAGVIPDKMVLFGVGLILVGLVFKIGIVPFHFWVPDVYSGAPAPVTAYMASVIKIAAVAATLRVLWVMFGAYEPIWSGAVWFLAVLTMIFGNLIALRQRNVKRMLAYSSIAHAGYILMAFLVPDQEFGGGAAILYYLIAYSFMTLGAFGVLMGIQNTEESEEAYDISHFRGIAKIRPGLAFLMTLFLFSLAGLPPGMGGFLAKFYVLGSTIKAGYVGLTVIGVLCSVVGCYYYLRVVVAMYFLSPEEGSLVPEEPNFPLTTALMFCGVGILFIGIFPSLVYDVAAAAVIGIAD